MQQPESDDRGRGPDRFGLSSLLIYLAVSVFLFGRSLSGRLSTSFIGYSSDPSGYMWCLVWWPYAIAHRMNPLVTSVIYSPTGVNLGWGNCVPLAAWLASPITRAYGPVAAYNILLLLSPALAGWTAFVLCRYITRRYWPALLGGYIFGFSSYMAAHMNAHLNLVLVFPVPLALYLVLRRLNGDIGARSFTIMLAMVLTAQFLCAVEILATITFFGGTTMLLAFALAAGEIRQRLYATLLNLTAAYGLTLVLLSPYLYFMFAEGSPQGAIWPTEKFSADLLNFVIPTQSSLVGQFQVFKNISSAFRGNLAEASAYLGPGLILIAAAFAISQWRKPLTRLLIVSLAIIWIASMGNVLHVAGAEKVPLPWRLFSHLPLIDKALPGRFVMYAFLDLAVITALWLSAGPKRAIIRPALGIASVVLLLPNLNADYWVNPADLPPFFSTGLYVQYLHKDEVVMPMPGDSGDSMLWQAQTDMYFRLADGYLGPDPPGFGRWNREKDRQLLEFLARHNVSKIVVGDWSWRFGYFGGTRSWRLTAHSSEKSRLYLSALGVEPLSVGGVLIYQVPPELVAPYAHSGDARTGGGNAVR